MKFKRPPIVELWIGFHCAFASEESEAAWSEESALSFIKRLDVDFANPELLWSREMMVEERSFDAPSPQIKAGAPTLERVRVFRPDGSRCLQLFRARLVYNWIKSGQDYPRFERVYNEAAEMLSRYFAAFHPRAVTSAVIHYVDLIELPERVGTPFQLDKYFRLRPELPEGSLPDLRDFAMRLNFPGIRAHDVQTVRFRNEPPAEGRPTFRMEWQYICNDIEEKPGDSLAGGLREAHDHAVGNWVASLQPDMLQLFEPTE